MTDQMSTVERQCGRCKGHGQVTTIVYDRMGARWPGEVRCRACGGTGKRPEPKEGAR